MERTVYTSVLNPPVPSEKCVCAACKGTRDFNNPWHASQERFQDCYQGYRESVPHAILSASQRQRLRLYASIFPFLHCWTQSRSFCFLISCHNTLPIYQILFSVHPCYHQSSPFPPKLPKTAFHHPSLHLCSLHKSSAPYLERGTDAIRAVTLKPTDE